MIGEQWAKSSFSHTSGCVEVAPDSIRRVVQVRNSKDRHGPTVTFTWWDWAGVLNEVRRGIFDFHRRLYPLEFDQTEREAFIAGVVAGEFDLSEGATA